MDFLLARTKRGPLWEDGPAKAEELGLILLLPLILLLLLLLLLLPLLLLLNIILLFLLPFLLPSFFLLLVLFCRHPRVQKTPDLYMCFLCFFLDTKRDLHETSVRHISPLATIGACRKIITFL